MNYNISKLPGLQTKILGRTFFHEKTVASTQTVVKEMLANAYGSGTTVLADHQSQGKGTKGREWISLSKPQIFLSFAMDRSMLPFSQIPILNLILGICMVQVLRKFGVEHCGLKWPNDIYIAGKKVCGILSELVNVDGGKTFIVSGVGLNHEGHPDEFPPPLQKKATILNLHLSQMLTREHLIASFFNELEHNLDQIKQKGLDLVQRDFETLWIYRDQRISVQDGNSVFTGVADSIDSNGALLLETSNGIERILSGEITLRHETET